MNLDRHMEAHRDLFRNLVKGDGDSATEAQVNSTTSISL